MKARVKATGEIVEISEDSSYVNAQHFEKVYYLDELEWIDVKKDTDPDYWTRLEHQAAIGAMQAYIIASHISQFSFHEGNMKDCKSMAHALVEMMKEEK